ncbi:MAG TPA: VWA domain-containing protein [Terriglobales bacterium]|nr:VWA domain-containing protein [Terriglobales bacterium]
MPSFRHHPKRRLLFLFGPVACAVVLAAQQPTTYSVEVKVVNVLTTVRDKHGKIVNNLSQEDFILDEDGRPQNIRYFSRETDLPLTLGLLVDTSLSQRRVLDQERSASGTFVDRVLREDKDSAYLIHFDREVELLQDLTSSKRKLEESLRLLQMPAPEQDRDRGGYPGGGGGYPGGGGGSGRGGHSHHHGGGTLLYDSVYLASDELMQKQRGRKAIIILTDGVDQGSKMTLDRAIESAQRADTVVYSILFADPDAYGSRGNWGGRGGISGPWGRPGGGYPGGYPPRSPQPQQEHADGKKVLERISQETGGRMFEVSKKQTVDQIYQQIQDELRNQYNLGYTPDRASDGPEYHKIHVATKQKDLVVQARDGYYSARPQQSQAGQRQN